MAVMTPDSSEHSSGGFDWVANSSPNRLNAAGPEQGTYPHGPQFGEWFTGIYASESNPHRHGRYVRTIQRTGRMNKGVFYELTDGHGDFWQYPRESVQRKDCETCHNAGWMCAAHPDVPADFERGHCCGCPGGCPSANGCPDCGRAMAPYTEETSS